MRRTVHVSQTQVANLQRMTDEQLATADELIRETMTRYQAEGDRAIMLKLFEQQCAVSKECKDRVAKKHAARGRLW